LRGGRELDKILVRKGSGSGPLKEILHIAAEKGIPVLDVPLEKLNRVTTKNHQGVIAFVSPVGFASLETIIAGVYEQGRDPFILILDRVTDVRNFGALCRTAECAGVDAVIIPSRGSARIGADALKSSAGALQNIAVCREANLKNSLKYLKDCGIKIAGCTEKTEGILYQTDLTGPVAVVMGSEEDGISPEYLKFCDIRVKIPMKGKTGSLNVAAAAAVCLYEIVRQRS
jgi:23S rRNA (guanosine2251-2'-O)-methyltransferase